MTLLPGRLLSSATPSLVVLKAAAVFSITVPVLLLSFEDLILPIHLRDRPPVIYVSSSVHTTVPGSCGSESVILI